MLFQTLLSALMLLILPAAAQFQFFEQMFNQGGPQQQQPQNAGSDSGAYQQNYENTHCDKYLCPQTLSCVHFPHHCPCAWPAVEDKVEFGDGSMACVSKGGFKAGEAARKIELARKGLL
ncbi:Long chronological lifespan protein 2 [Cryoendolithus antarcticus]|uniref:Long chronological lifespan protein 2 n=1 Tax=Cryoendolithus antarcticus TaxID=1507870 RepID=A0A1V8TR63_9PEZI|nr:Long chronological lifespan protein 2 [Cryoendolithus antarcticus]OQO15334.1 Long chronological lifespan protein 2 [Cryoendolithus antarcticus]OQO29709.1 Long chronological lifespan protein 2 [Rachicladosporium sp. CCFEE 5018]